MPSQTLLRRYYAVLFTLALPYLLISSSLRLLLWWQFGLEEGVGWGQLPLILLTGLLNDALEALYLLLPFSLFYILLPQRWHGRSLHRAGLMLSAYLWLFSLFYLAAAEYFFFEEFNARFNLVAVDYLIYPHEVFINIWQSYPVSWVLAVNALLSTVLLYFLWPRLVAHQPARRPPMRHRLLLSGTHLALITAGLLSVSTYSLAFSHNRLAHELGANGVSSFFLALRTNELDYDVFYRTADADEMQTLLSADLARQGGELSQPGSDSLQRHFPARPEGAGKLNIMLIVEESFGAEFVGALGDQRGLTPEFDKLSQQGLLFTQAYASGTRTVRGLEALTTSLPPIPSESIVKRPGNENIANWGQLMAQQGYHSAFLYGGYGYFDNMSPFFSHNGFAVRDRSDIPEPEFTNIWGVSDGDLLRYARRYCGEIHQQGQPFFTLVMTTSNHKPYTFPAGVPGVKPEGGGRDAGVRYADYALGEFFRAAEQEPWFDDTLFIVVADHGARVYGRAEIPLETYHIPLLLYAPKHLQARRVDTPISQIDVAPTTLGLLGLEYEAPFFGRDRLNPAIAALPSRLFFNHNHKVALYQDGELAILGLQASAETYAYDAQNRRYTPLPPNQALIDLATAYYQIAFTQFKERRYRLN